MSELTPISNAQAIDILLSDQAARATFDAESARFALLDRIIVARTDRGWSQAELASRLGWKRPAVSRLEAGNTDPRWSTIVAVLTAPDLPMSVGGTELTRTAS